MSLPPFPLDDGTLNALRDSLNRVNNGDGTYSGCDFSTTQLLDFLSGHTEDSPHQVHFGPDPIFGAAEVEFRTYDEPIYSEQDAMRALVDEVLRMRTDIKALRDASYDAFQQGDGSTLHRSFAQVLDALIAPRDQP